MAEGEKMAQTPEAPRGISRRDFLRGTLIGALGVIATACEIKPTPEKPTPTKAPPTPEKIPTPTPEPTLTPTPEPTATPEPTPTPKPTATLEVVSIPESIFPEYGVLVGDMKTKKGVVSGGLLIANWPGTEEYMVYALWPKVEGSWVEGGHIFGYKFTLTEVAPGIYTEKEPRRLLALKELRTDGETLKAVVSRENLEVFPREVLEYDVLLAAAGKGRQAVIDAIKHIKIRIMELGPGTIKDESVIKDLKEFDIILP